tara:strand:+ start:81 stop:665 length:585 start_codon:yes stop_codon:yes gene_type:complete
MSGQINRGSQLGELIFNLVKNKNYKNFLEIGTWNGQGSTKCFIDALLERGDDYSFISIEADINFYNEAKNFHKDNLSSKIQIIHGNIIDVLDLMEPNSEEEKKWLNNDLNNYKNCRNVWGYIHRKFDVVLLDGGEFSTYQEFLKLKELTKVFVLDDTKMTKTRQVLKDLNNDSNWILNSSSKDRNGFAIFTKNE